VGTGVYVGCIATRVAPACRVGVSGDGVSDVGVRHPDSSGMTNRQTRTSFTAFIAPPTHVDRGPVGWAFGGASPSGTDVDGLVDQGLIGQHLKFILDRIVAAGHKLGHKEADQLLDLSLKHYVQ
jgi:hypothetical protein